MLAKNSSERIMIDTKQYIQKNVSHSLQFIHSNNIFSYFGTPYPSARELHSREHQSPDPCHQLPNCHDAISYNVAESHEEIVRLHIPNIVRLPILNRDHRLDLFHISIQSLRTTQTKPKKFTHIKSSQHTKHQLYKPP